MTGRRRGLGDILVEERLIGREQLNQAQRAADRLGAPLVVVLLDQSLISEDELVAALGRHLRIERFYAGGAPVDPEAVREVPFETAVRYHLLPVQLHQDDGRRVLRVAMADPLDTQAIEDIELFTACVVEPLIARPSELTEAVRLHYRGVVTKIIQRPARPTVAEAERSRRVAGAAASRARSTARSPRRVFGADLDPERFHTRPLERNAEAGLGPGRVDDHELRHDYDLELRHRALLGLLIDKGLITRAEYDEAVLALSAQARQPRRRDPDPVA